MSKDKLEPWSIIKLAQLLAACTPEDLTVKQIEELNVHSMRDAVKARIRQALVGLVPIELPSQFTYRGQVYELIDPWENFVGHRTYSALVDIAQEQHALMTLEEGYPFFEEACKSWQVGIPPEFRHRVQFLFPKWLGHSAQASQLKDSSGRIVYLRASSYTFAVMQYGLGRWQIAFRGKSMGDGVDTNTLYMMPYDRLVRIKE